MELSSFKPLIAACDEEKHGLSRYHQQIPATVDLQKFFLQNQGLIWLLKICKPFLHICRELAVVDANKICIEQFEEEYDIPAVPCMMKNAINSWPGMIMMICN
jgi:hypothetical protein